MGYLKTTTISGHTSSPRPSEELRFRYLAGDPDAVKEWKTQFKAWSRVFSLSGHWNPERALNYARKRGCVEGIEVEHHTLDTNGKGRSSIDKRMTVDEGKVTVLPPATEEEQLDFADIVEMDD